MGIAELDPSYAESIFSTTVGLSKGAHRARNTIVNGVRFTPLYDFLMGIVPVVLNPYLAKPHPLRPKALRFSALHARS